MPRRLHPGCCWAAGAPLGPPASPAGALLPAVRQQQPAIALGGQLRPPTRPPPRSAPQGDVLEISAGTGRNLPYYRYGDITSLTLADVSEPMLKRAEQKYFDVLQVRRAGAAPRPGASSSSSSSSEQPG